MDETLMKKLDAGLDRRSFLRGSSLFAVALGLSVVSPLTAFAQEQEKKKDEKKKEEPPQADDPFAEEEKLKGEQDTRRDAQGREVRTCPQCGADMYRQGRTWTCENCGYSYVE